MKKMYHLAACSTCAAIIKDTGVDKKGIELQDIKTEKITPVQIDEMAKLAGSYESLFSRVALKYRSMGLNTKKLSEKDFRKLILEEYTFLKRPVLIAGSEIFIGNSPKNVKAAEEALKK